MSDGAREAGIGASCAILLALLAPQVCAAEPAGVAHRGNELRFEPCTLAAPGLPISVTAQCARLAVPLDRADADAKHIELAVAKITSNAKRPRPDPVFMLAGGPGQGARESYPAVAVA